MLNPLVSIIIPTYNRAHLIGETLDSVITQTYSNWECIVVDEGSTDYTEELMGFYNEQDLRIQYHQRSEDGLKGANASRNYGFELSKGELINWFDSDDVMLNNFLEGRIKLFKKNIKLIICSGYYVDENLIKIGRMKINQNYHPFKGIILGKQTVITNSILFKRSFFQSKKLFNPHITRGQETEFFSRLFFNLEPEFYLIKNYPAFLYRQHSGSKTSVNKAYVKQFKESASFIASENIKRSILLNDEELIIHYYKQLIILFLKGLENSHYTNSSFAYKSLLPILWKLNTRLFWEFLLVGLFLLKSKKSSYRLGKRYREYKLFKGN